MSDQHAPVVVVVDDTRYPVDLAAVTAAQTVWMRTQLGVSMGEMVTRIAVSLAELPEIVALMALSIEQAGGEPDLAGLLGSVTLSSVVEFEADTDLIDPVPTDDEVAAAVAVLERANQV